MKHNTFNYHAEASSCPEAEQIIGPDERTDVGSLLLARGKPDQIIQTLYDSSKRPPLKLASRIPPTFAALLLQIGFPPERLLELAARSEAQLYRIGLDVSSFNGAQVKLTAFRGKGAGGHIGDPVPRITIVRGKTGWYLSELSVVGNLALPKERNELWLTPRQHAHLTWRLHSQYNVYQPKTGKPVLKGLELIYPFLQR